jgi:hypothetical protein
MDGGLMREGNGSRKKPRIIAVLRRQRPVEQGIESELKANDYGPKYN